MDTRKSIAEKAEGALSSFFKLSNETIADEARTFAVRTTSGTSDGQPVICVQKIQKEFLHRFKDARRPLLMFGSNNTRLFNALMASLTDQACVFKVIDIAEIGESFGEMVEEFDPDSIVGFPGFIALSTSSLSEKTRLLITQMVLTGERLSPTQAYYLNEQYTNARIRMQYAAAECGLIADQCESLVPNFYHPIEGMAVEFEHDEEQSNLLLTSQRDGGISLQRYAIGDKGVRRKNTCSCGKMTFEHLGRTSEDYFSLSGARITGALFEEALRAAHIPFAGARLKLEERIIDGRLVGFVTLLVQEPFLQVARANINAFQNAFRVTGMKYLSDLVREKIFLPAAVESDASVYHKQRIFRE